MTLTQEDGKLLARAKDKGGVASRMERDRTEDKGKASRWGLEFGQESVGARV